jgi:carbamoyl-phosphate synthase large subunit
MRSTGEVMGIDANFGAAFAKSQLAAGVSLPKEGIVFISLRDADKEAITEPARDLVALGFKLIATSGTADHLEKAGVAVERVNKVLEGRPHVVDAMKNGLVHLVFNTTEGAQSLTDSFSIRRTALMQTIPYYTTVSGARAAIEAIKAVKARALDVRALQTYS